MSLREDWDMTQMYQYPPAYPIRSTDFGLQQRKQVSAADIAISVVLFMFACGVGLVAAYATLFFAFASDSCGYQTCNDSYMTAAFAVSWGGTAFALVGSLVMIVVAAVRRTMMWIWPTLALVVIVGSFFLGVACAAQVAG